MALSVSIIFIGLAIRVQPCVIAFLDSDLLCITLETRIFVDHQISSMVSIYVILKVALFTCIFVLLPGMFQG